MLDAAKSYVRCPDVAWRRIADDALLVDPRDGRIFPLNPVSARIWELLESERRPADIADVLIEEFDAPADAIRRDAYAFIEKLVDERLAEEWHG